jgi:signal peptidase II
VQRYASRSLLLVLLLATVGCDRVTKSTAVALLSDSPPRSFLHDTVRLELTTNTGAFLSLGADWAPLLRFVLLGMGSAVLLVGLAVIALQSGWRRWTQAGAVLIIAGGGSNLVDRLLTGGVVDFLNVGIGSLRTGIFNIADVAIMAGAVLLGTHAVQRRGEVRP